MKKPIFFDIETGGLEPRGKRASSILSLAWSQQEVVKEKFAYPQLGSWVSSFSEQTVMPQVAAAPRVYREKEVINDFIQTLKSNPDAPLAGYNIQNFDIPFLRQRAHELGLGRQFDHALRGRRRIDLGLRAKMQIAESISSHIDRGTFSQELGGLTWSQAQSKWGRLPFQDRPLEFRMLAQMRAFQQGVQSPEDVIARQVRGWKLEQVAALLDPKNTLLTKAHEASADVLMTAQLYRAIGQGELKAVLETEEGARAWLAGTVQSMSQGKKYPADAGAAYYPNAISRLKAHWMRTPKPIRAGLGVMAATATAIGLYGAVAGMFTAKDDAYNSVEALRHGGIGAQIRKNMTDFGSGFRGLIKIPEVIAKHTNSKFYGAHASLEFGESLLANYIKDFNAAKSAMKATATDIPIGLPKDVQTFAKDLMQAKQAGYSASMFLNVGQIQTAAKEFGLSPTALIKHTIAHERIHQARYLWRGEKAVVADAPRKFLRYMQADPAYTKKAATWGEEYLANVAAVMRYPTRTEFDPRVASVMMHSSTEQLAKAKQQIGALETLGKAARKKRMVRYRREQKSTVSGKDDAHNKVTGLQEKGKAQQLRKANTPFGSGWNALRNLVKAGETFDDMISSKAFQTAISNAEEVKSLGQGQFGTALLMRGKFRDTDFSFVRKKGLIGDYEAETMATFADEFAPNVYRAGQMGDDSFIDMEFIEGMTANAAAEKGLWKQSHLKEVERQVKELHARDLSHGDIHGGNVMLTRDGQVALMDYGTAGPVGQQIGAHQGSRSMYLNVNDLDVREKTFDLVRLERYKQEYAQGTELTTSVIRARIERGSLPREVPDEFSLGPETAPARASLLKSNPQMRSAMSRKGTEACWKAGRDGGRKSRI